MHNGVLHEGFTPGRLAREMALHDGVLHDGALHEGFAPGALHKDGPLNEGGALHEGSHKHLACAQGIAQHIARHHMGTAAALGKRALSSSKSEREIMRGTLRTSG